MSFERGGIAFGLVRSMLYSKRGRLSTTFLTTRARRAWRGFWRGLGRARRRSGGVFRGLSCVLGVYPTQALLKVVLPVLYLQDVLVEDAELTAEAVNLVLDLFESGLNLSRTLLNA